MKAGVEVFQTKTVLKKITQRLGNGTVCFLINKTKADVLIIEIVQHLCGKLCSAGRSRFNESPRIAAKFGSYGRLHHRTLGYIL